MKKLVVLISKGGTVKTKIVTSFAALAKGKVLVDCDVDAADLHLLLKPDVHKSEEC
jgi:MinD superfamily P-loop ATPase